MEVQYFFSLCKIYHPTWIQVDRRNVEQSELWLFRPLYHKTGKHAFRSEIILWQILFRVFIEPCTNQDWSKCIICSYKLKENCCQWWYQQTIHETGVWHRHLVAGFKNIWATESRFERVGSQISKGNGQIGFPLKNFVFVILLTH